MTRKDLKLAWRDNIIVDGVLVDYYLDLSDGHLLLRQGLTTSEVVDAYASATSVVEGHPSDAVHDFPPHLAARLRGE
jgi:hypothetical protein